MLVTKSFQRFWHKIFTVFKHCNGPKSIHSSRIQCLFREMMLIISKVKCNRMQRIPRKERIWDVKAKRKITYKGILLFYRVTSIASLMRVGSRFFKVFILSQFWLQCIVTEFAACQRSQVSFCKTPFGVPLKESKAAGRDL